jgi:dimethylhistidine N-methyltransferase
MPPPDVAKRYTLIDADREARLSSFAEEVARGLGSHPKRLPCRFFYDEAGSELFEAICELPEYYLTRAEREILAERADEIAGLFDAPIALAELGSGSSAKTRLLIEACLRRHGGLRYVPVDISRSMLEASALALLRRYQGLEIRAIASEYGEGLRHVRAETERPKLIVWLGSNVGNFGRAEAARFLAEIGQAMAAADRLLVGIDLRKDRAALERAYDDAQGVTARFNLNLLARIDRELGGEFALAHFAHRARWDEDEGRVQMHLVSLREQSVAIRALGVRVAFARGEAIHTEDSYKYDAGESEALARAAGLRLARRWLDREKRFSLNLLARA